MGAGQQITAPEGDSQACQELAPWPGNVAEEAPGNAWGRIRTSEMLQPLCSLVC